MLSSGHAHVGRRVARLFGSRLVLGTVVRWMPACRTSGEPALFRAVHDDGDEEDLDEHEAEEAAGEYPCWGSNPGLAGDPSSFFLSPLSSPLAH